MQRVGLSLEPVGGETDCTENITDPFKSKDHFRCISLCQLTKIKKTNTGASYLMLAF